MKVSVVLLSCIVCFASASFYDVLEHDSNDLVSDFWLGMDQAPSLASLDSELGEEAEVVEEDVKFQLAVSLTKVMEKVLEHIHQSFEKAEKAAKTFMAKAAELVERLKSLFGVGEELQDRIREQIKDWLAAFLEKISLFSHEYSLVRVPLELDEKNLMENVKQNILERLNLKEIVDYVKEHLEKLGELGRALLEALQRPGALEKLKGILEVLLPGLRQDYSLADLWAKVRDFFKGLGVKISEKFSEFSSWVKTVAEKGWATISDKAGKLKELAKTVASKAGSLSKKAAEQALEFFKEHKEEIGQVVWSLVKGALTSAIASAG